MPGVTEFILLFFSVWVREFLNIKSFFKKKESRLDFKVKMSTGFRGVVSPPPE